VATFTLTAFSVAPDRVTVKRTASPSAADPPEIEKLGGSSLSVIVPVASPSSSAISAGSPGSLRTTRKVSSSGSSRESSVTATVRVFSVSSAAKLRVWAVVTAVKSAVEAASASSAVSSAVVHFTETAFSVAPPRVTVKVTPESSSAAASAIEKEGGSSSSSISRVRLGGFGTPAWPVTVPETVTSLAAPR